MRRPTTTPRPSTAPQPAAVLPGNKYAEELAAMSEILDALPDLVPLVHADLTRGKRSDTGRPGMSAEQVLRALVIKQMHGFSYEELEFHLADSLSFRTFCRFGEGDPLPKRSTLHENIKKISSETLECLNRAVVKYARDVGVETGTKVRGDSTGVEANIHPPTDSSLLDDTVRTLARLMKKGRVFGVTYRDRKKRAKKLAFEIFNAKKSRERRTTLYRALVKVAEKMLAEASSAVVVLRSHDDARAHDLAVELDRFIDLGRRVVDQTSRRVFERKAVPATEKLVSIFEEHADILVKGQQDPVYGHKVYLLSGESFLVFDCFIADGNPSRSRRDLAG